jgi:hypothetical protein
MAVGDVATLRIKYLSQTVQLYNLLQFEQVGATNLATLIDLWQSVGSPNLITRLRSYLPSYTLIDSFEAFWARSLSIDTATGLVGLAGTGIFSSGALPLQMSVVTSWRTGYAGRRWRGRTYWPAPAPGSGSALSSSTGQWNSTILTNANNLATSLLSVFDGTYGWRFCVYSRAQNRDFPGYAPAPVLHYIVDARPATQRRRGLIHNT